MATASPLHAPGAMQRACSSSGLFAQAGGKDSTVLAQLLYYLLARFRCDVGAGPRDCDGPDQKGDGHVNPR